MPHSLLLRMPAAGEDAGEWLGIDATGLPEATRQRGPLSLAAAVGSSADVIVLVPATQILLAEPELPPGSGVKLARAVPFALEEQLTEDIDQLVFALGKRRPGGGTPVAVVGRTVLQGWLSTLSDAGIEPTALYPDMSLLPLNPGQTVLWLEGSRLAVRRPGKLPFAVELTPVKEALIVAGVIADPFAEAGAGAGEDPLGEHAILYLTREDWAKVEDEVQEVADQFASLKIQLLPDGPLPWLARSVAGTDAVNLLQGEFARTTDYGARWRRWRTALALAGGLFVVHVAADAVQLHQARQETAAIDTEITQVFSSAMPAEPMHDPRQQMQLRLERIRHSGAGPELFLRALQAFSSALAVTPKITIDSLSYNQGSMEMKVTAPSLAELAQLAKIVGKQGLTADIKSSTPNAAGVEAHLQVRTAGPVTQR
jgi:general secretion pathway protein L